MGRLVSYFKLSSEIFVQLSLSDLKMYEKSIAKCLSYSRNSAIPSIDSIHLHTLLLVHFSIVSVFLLQYYVYLLRFVVTTLLFHLPLITVFACYYSVYYLRNIPFTS